MISVVTVVDIDVDSDVDSDVDHTSVPSSLSRKKEVTSGTSE